jgi:peroxiredoxin/mono/diheme cytochrome c family protein
VCSRCLLLVCCWVVSALHLCLHDSAFAGEAADYPTGVLPTSDGSQRDLAELRGEKATVLVFNSIHCPISRGYTPTLNNLAEKYAERGVRIVALNPNAGQSLREMETHRREFDFQFPLLKDAGGKIARQLGVKACPEVCLFDGQGKLRYQGRIDDRYIRRGASAVDARSDDLKNALADVLAGKAVRLPRTETLGCPVDFPSEPAAEPGKTYQVDYSRHVSRILRRHCQECHREGGIGPFQLTQYQHAVTWADDIRTFTAEGDMPPWKAESGFGDFVDPRVMPQKDIDTIAKWVELGCPEGDPKELPPPRTFRSGWRLGEPDLVLQPSKSYTVSADGSDEYRCFVMPTDFDEDRFVVAAEVLPGNASVVHHVILFLDQHGEAARLAKADPAAGYVTSGGYPGFVPDGNLGGWAPGNTPDRLPDGMARVLSKGADVVMQVHYHKTGKVEEDRTRIGLHFARKPVNRAVLSLAVLPPEGPLGGMRIPAGAENHEVRTSLVMPVDMIGLAVTPHMHLLGKDMKVTATLPDGKLRPLVWVRNWDFNWQESYQFIEPIELPRGTRIDLTAHFDNSEKNPYNPHRPPQDVSWGEETTDEMCIAFLEVASKKKAARQEDVHFPTPAERLRFILEARRLSGDTTPLLQNKWLRAILRSATGGASAEQEQKEGSSDEPESDSNEGP